MLVQVNLPISGIKENNIFDINKKNNTNTVRLTSSYNKEAKREEFYWFRNDTNLKCNNIECICCHSDIVTVWRSFL